jgi:hypothetical protein
VKDFEHYLTFYCPLAERDFETDKGTLRSCRRTMAAVIFVLVMFAFGFVPRAESAASYFTPPVEPTNTGQAGVPASAGQGPGFDTIPDSGNDILTHSIGLKAARFLPSLNPTEESPAPAESGGFQWKPALRQSAIFLVYQHAFRFATEAGTRSELKGPFFKDYIRSLKGMHGWEDNDSFLVNYIGHPMMGCVTGWIQIQNDSRGGMQQFGKSEGYWNSRMRAMAWSAAYSLQFELGPVSEASLGNVGKDQKTMGTVDLVVTPLAGTGWLVMEDALDRYLIRRLESGRKWNAIIRSVLNPGRSVANALRGKYPWFRQGAGLEQRLP